MSIPAQSSMSTPYWQKFDSPARQLHREMNQLYISDQEHFRSQLDRENEDREHTHRQALAAAAAQHERVRQSVELERRKLEAQIRAEQDRREAEARREIERQQQEKIQRDLEEKRNQIERTKALEAKRKEREDLERSQREAEEKARLEEERRVAEEEAEKRRTLQRTASHNSPASPPDTSSPAPNAALASTTPVRPPPAASSQVSRSIQEPQITTPSQARVASSTPLWEEEHNVYLEIHKRLKELRRFMSAESRKNKPLKDIMGDMRRDMRKSVGQLTEGKGANKQPLANILKLLKKALSFGGPTMPVPPFLAQLPDGAPQDGQGPALLLYLLNIFSKAIISQWVDEAGVSPKSADPVGVIASHIFAQQDFKWHNTSLISILLAKLHKTCPVLFGIYGPEDTVQGKTRLGWVKDENGWLTRQRHYERMTGLASGFAALSLRNYERAKFTNPYPDYHYWQALAKIANTPSQNLTQTHFVVLKGMIEHYEGKFIGFYGQAAVAALRFVLVNLPNKLPGDQKGGVAVKGVQALVEVLRRDSKLVL